LRKLLVSSFAVFVFGVSLFGFTPENEKKLEEAIKIEYQKEYPTIVISIVKIEDMVKEERQNLRYVGLEMQRQNLQRDSGVILAVFESDKNSTKRVFVRYKIEALLTVVKAKYNLQKDKIITSEDIMTESIRFNNFYSKPLSESTVQGLATKRFIALGTVLTQKDATKPPVIKKNSLHGALMRQKGLEIELEVAAMQDGNCGETISVKAKNGTIMKAFITTNNRLEIQ